MELIQKIQELDIELFLYLNSFHNDFWDTIMLMITRKEPWYPFYAILLFYVIKNYRKKSWLILLLLGITLLLSDQISVLIKDTVQRYRPVHNPQIEHMVHNILRKGSLYGFVSSHAANAFAIWAFLTRLFRHRSFWLLMLAWALLVSYSRIYAGMHYPHDIIAGALLGWLIGIGTYKLLMFIENRFPGSGNPKIETVKLETSQAGIIFLVTSLILVMVFITTYVLHHYNYL